MIWEAFHIVTTFKKQQPPSYPSLERYRKKAFNKHSVPREGVDWKWMNIVEAFDFDPRQGQICRSLPVRRDIRQTVLTRKREDSQESRRQRAAVAVSDSESSEIDEDKIGVVRSVNEIVVALGQPMEAAVAAPPPPADQPPCCCGNLCRLQRHHRRTCNRRRTKMFRMRKFDIRALFGSFQCSYA